MLPCPRHKGGVYDIKGGVYDMSPQLYPNPQGGWLPHHAWLYGTIGRGLPSNPLKGLVTKGSPLSRGEFTTRRQNYMVHDNEKLRREKMRPRHIPYCVTTLAPFHTSLQDRGGAGIFFTSLTRATVQIGFKKTYEKFCFLL